MIIPQFCVPNFSLTRFIQSSYGLLYMFSLHSLVAVFLGNRNSFLSDIINKPLQNLSQLICRRFGYPFTGLVLNQMMH